MTGRIFIIIPIDRLLLAQTLLKVLADGLDEDERVDSLGLDALHEVDEVLGDDTAVHRVEASALQLVAEVDESLDAVLLTTLAERAAPSEDRSDRVGRSLLAGEVLVVVAGRGQPRTRSCHRG